jgi:hypothetical protein
MSDHILKTIEQAKEELRKQEEAVSTTKKLINQLCAFGGMPPIFSDAELQSTLAQPAAVRRNSFFGKPLATCVREFLEMRKDKPVKEASLSEILEALKDGGFDLDRISKDKDGVRRGVAITLAKNPQFIRLPNDDWGLLAWYPNVRKSKPDGNGKSSSVERSQEEMKEAPEPLVGNTALADEFELKQTEEQQP